MENPIMKKGKNGLKYSVATTLILNIIIYFIPNLREDLQDILYIAVNTTIGIIVGSTDLISDYVQAKTDLKKQTKQELEAVKEEEETKDGE